MLTIDIDALINNALIAAAMEAYQAQRARLERTRTAIDAAKVTLATAQTAHDALAARHVAGHDISPAEIATAAGAIRDARTHLEFLQAAAITGEAEAARLDGELVASAGEAWRPVAARGFEVLPGIDGKLAKARSLIAELEGDRDTALEAIQKAVSAGLKLTIPQNEDFADRVRLAKGKPSQFDY